MTLTNRNNIALLRIGSVTAVKTSGIEISVDSDKNEPSILYMGDVIDNVTGATENWLRLLKKST